jgi:hypothetical protein
VESAKVGGLLVIGRRIPSFTVHIAVNIKSWRLLVEVKVTSTNLEDSYL